MKTTTTPTRVLRLDVNEVELDILAGCFCYTLQSLGGDISGAITTMSLLGGIIQIHQADTKTLKEKLSTLIETF